MCAPSPPPPPDYAAAATAQGAANVDAARIQGRLNNPNVINPYGSQTVSWEGDTPTLTQALSPEQQALYDQRVGNQRGLGDLAGRALPGPNETQDLAPAGRAQGSQQGAHGLHYSEY